MSASAPTPNPGPEAQVVLMVCGLELVTADDVAGRWGDVRAARLRAWCLRTRERPPLLRPVTVGQLAALYGRAVPADTSPDTPARIPGPSGPQNLYEWSAVVRAERKARTGTTGPSRRKNHHGV